MSVARRRVLAQPRGLARNPSPRCLEFRFYNRRCASRAPAETSPSETVGRAPWENPPALDFQIAIGFRGVSAEPRATPDHLAVIQPPTAARLTACCRLRVDRRSPSCSWHGVRGELRCFIGWQKLRRIEPSDISRGGWSPGCRSNPFSSRVSPFPPGHVNAPDVPEPEMPSTGERPRERSCESPARSAAPLASGDSRRTCSPMFENID